MSGKDQRLGLSKLTEALVANVEVPKVDAQVVSADIRLPIRVDRDRVDMISVRVGIDLSWDGGYDGLVQREPWQAEVDAASLSRLRDGKQGGVQVGLGRLPEAVR